MTQRTADSIMPLQAFLRAKVQFAALPSDPSGNWKLRRRLEALLAPLPAPCLLELTEVRAGFICLWHGDNEYRPDVVRCQGHDALQAVAFINAGGLLDDPRPGLRAVARLMDHFLGSYLALPARYISDEEPGIPGWDDFHRRLVAACCLHYADDPAAHVGPGPYLQWAWTEYLLQPRELNTLDPAAYRLLRSTVFSPSFWRGHPRRPRPSTTAIV